MSAEADILRGLTAPVTVLALKAGADALDTNARLMTVNAELGQANTALAAENAKLRLQLEQAQQPTPTPIPTPAPTSTVFSIDVSSLGGDANLTEAKKIADHKTLLAAPGLQNVRVFFGNNPLTWNNTRIATLGDKDSLLISFNKWDRAALRTFLAATPERFRQRPGQVKYCFKHEFEAEWRDSTDKTKWLSDWLGANAAIGDELVRTGVGSHDDVVKILLWYSQHIDARTKGTWELFHGGQDFGYMGMDCYHYQPWLTKGRYATPEELFGLLGTIGTQTGRPICVPEWGGELATGDTDGSGRAKAITEGGAYQRKIGVRFSNWWCAAGSKDAVTGSPREHHLDKYASNVAAYKALMR